VRQGVLEGVLDIGEQPGLGDEFRRLEMSQPLRQITFGQPGDRAELGQRHVLSDDRRRLEQALLSRRQAVDPRGENGLNRLGQLDDLNGLHEAIGTALAREHARLGQRAYALLEKERIALRPLDQERPQRRKLRVVTQEGFHERVGRGRPQRIESDLAVVGLAAPAVPVLEPVVDQKQDAIRRQALDEALEQRLRVGVDPVEVLEDEEQGLRLALAQEDAPDRVEDPLTLRLGA
jgi:hypothetical protein